MKSPQHDLNRRAAEIEMLTRSLQALTTAALFAATLILGFVIAHIVMQLGLGLPDVLIQADALAAM